MGAIAATAPLCPEGAPDSAGEAREGPPRSPRWWVWSFGCQHPLFVLVADEDPIVRRTLAAAMRRAGFEVEEAHEGPEAAALLRDLFDRRARVAHVDVVLASSALCPPPSDGSCPSLPVVIAATPVLWIGRPGANRRLDLREPSGLVDAVERLAGLAGIRPGGR